MKRGQSVRVKDGVLCPDNDDFDLSGWQGRVTDLHEEEKTVVIAWDSLTLKAMPEEFIIDCEREGLDWAVMYLSVDQVVLAKARDAKKVVERMVEDLRERFRWVYPAGDDGHLQEVLKEASSLDNYEVMKAWGRYLSQHLTFPFASVVDRSYAKHPLERGQELSVLRIDLVDDLYGVIVAGRVRRRVGRRRYDIPLADLAVMDKDSSNVSLVESYREWFVNG